MADEYDTAPKISQDAVNNRQRWHEFMPYQGDEIVRLSDIIADSAKILTSDDYSTALNVLAGDAEKSRLAARLKYAESELKRMSAQVAQARGVLAYVQMWSS